MPRSPDVGYAQPHTTAPFAPSPSLVGATDTGIGTSMLKLSEQAQSAYTEIKRADDAVTATKTSADISLAVGRLAEDLPKSDDPAKFAADFNSNASRLVQEQFTSQITDAGVLRQVEAHTASELARQSLQVDHQSRQIVLQRGRTALDNSLDGFARAYATADGPASATEVANQAQEAVRGVAKTLMLSPSDIESVQRKWTDVAISGRIVSLSEKGQINAAQTMLDVNRDKMDPLKVDDSARAIHAAKTRLVADFNEQQQAVVSASASAASPRVAQDDANRFISRWTATGILSKDEGEAMRTNTLAMVARERVLSRLQRDDTQGALGELNRWKDTVPAAKLQPTYEAVQVALRREDALHGLRAGSYLSGAQTQLATQGQLPSDFDTFTKGLPANSPYRTDAATLKSLEPEVKSFISLPLSDQAATVNKYVEAARASGAPADFQKAQFFAGTYNQTVQDVNHDWTAYARRIGVLKPGMPDYTPTQENTAIYSLEATRLQQTYGWNVDPIPADAIKQVRSVVKGDDLNAMQQWQDALRVLPGEQKTRLFTSIGDANPAFAYSLFVESSSTVRDIIAGSSLTNNKQTQEKNGDQIRSTINDTFGTQLDALPQYKQGLVAAATALYDARIRKDETFNKSKFQDFAKEAAGGLVTINGQDIVSPMQGIAQSTVTRAMKSLGDADMAKYGNGTPIWKRQPTFGELLNNPDVQFADLLRGGDARRAYWRPANMEGVYRLFDRDGGAVMTREGGYFAFDLRKYIKDNVPIDYREGMIGRSSVPQNFPIAPAGAQ